MALMVALPLVFSVGESGGRVRTALLGIWCLAFAAFMHRFRETDEVDYTRTNRVIHTIGFGVTGLMCLSIAAVGC